LFPHINDDAWSKPHQIYVNFYITYEKQTKQENSIDNDYEETVTIWILTSVAFPKCLVILADLFILLCVYKNHTPQCWYCLLLSLLNITLLFPNSFPLHFYPSLSRATPPAPSLSVIGQKMEGVYFQWLTNLKFSENNLKFPWKKNACNITKSC